MTADLRELFDQAGRDAPAPTLDPDAVVRRARRSRKRRVWLTAAGVGAAAAAVAVVVVSAAGGLHEAGPLPPTDPSPTPSIYPLAEHPLLVDADLASWHLGSAIPAEEWVGPAPLNPCLIDPLSLGAPQAVAGSYGGTTGRIANEYVLRFPDTAAAHRAVLTVWAGFNSCPHPRDEPVDPPSAASYVSYPMLDEYFGSQRGVPIGGLGRDSLMYKIHVAREGNVVVVIEDTGVTEDRPTSTQPLELAMIRAIPNYLATHPAVLCSINSPLCPQDIMNAPPFGGGG